jgi:energy-coupling factor transporter ATP-binding protein EcfA2
MALRARGVTTRSLPAELQALGMLLERPLSSLHRAEARAVELALALSLDAPIALVLHEPFLDVQDLARDHVVEGLARSVERGAAVMVITSSSDDAHALTESVLDLQAGVLKPAKKRPVAALELWLARVGSARTRALAHTLGAVEGVHSVSWRSADDTGTSILRVEANNLDEVARAVAREAASGDLEVHSLTTETP